MKNSIANIVVNKKDKGKKGSDCGRNLPKGRCNERNYFEYESGITEKNSDDDNS